MFKIHNVTEKNYVKHALALSIPLISRFLPEELNINICVAEGYYPELPRNTISFENGELVLWAHYHKDTNPSEVDLLELQKGFAGLILQGQVSVLLGQGTSNFLEKFNVYYNEDTLFKKADLMSAYVTASLLSCEEPSLYPISTLIKEHRLFFNIKDIINSSANSLNMHNVDAAFGNNSSMLLGRIARENRPDKAFHYNVEYQNLELVCYDIDDEDYEEYDDYDTGYEEYLSHTQYGILSYYENTKHTLRGRGTVGGGGGFQNSYFDSLSSIAFISEIIEKVKIKDPRSALLLDGIVSDITKASVDYKLHLNNVLEDAMFKSDYSMVRYNKRYLQAGLILPGLEAKTSKLLVALDYSASISKNELAEQLGVIDDLIESKCNNNVEVKVIVFSENIRKDHDIPIGESLRDHLNEICSNIGNQGGTNFQEIFNHIDMLDQDGDYLKDLSAVMVISADGLGGGIDLSNNFVQNFKGTICLLLDERIATQYTIDEYEQNLKSQYGNGEVSIITYLPSK